MRNSQILQQKLDVAIKTGEIPYQANRRAMMSLDVRDDGDKGMREVNLMLVGLDLFIEDLEVLRNASRGVAKRSIAALR